MRTELLIAAGMSLLLGCKSEPEKKPASIIISEAMAYHIKDQDWVELQNVTRRVISIEGWQLRHRTRTATLSGSMAPGEFKVVPLRLKRSGEISLHAGGKVVSSLRMPRQLPFISYGPDGYHLEPTRGFASAAPGLKGRVETPTVSVGRGVFEGPLNLVLSAPRGEIRYTLDTQPPEQGTVYTEPIALSGNEGVVVLRAVAILPGHLPSEEILHTYVFPETVLSAQRQPEWAPDHWGFRPRTEADYALAPVEGFAEGLRSLSVMSLTMDPKHLFGNKGLHMHLHRDKEHPATVELLGEDGFGMPVGVRISGKGDGGWTTKKLSFRVRFTARFGGPKRLKHPLFSDREDWFDSLILDGHNNYTYNSSHDIQRKRAQFVRDAFMADAMRHLGHLAPRTRFVHLFLNGMYWGLYDLHERPDAAFAALHLGGEPEDWMSIKERLRSPDGALEPFREAMDLSPPGDLVGPRYDRMAERLDLDNYLDYMLLNFWAGNHDWPRSNWVAFSPRAQPKWRFVPWDSEVVLAELEDDMTDPYGSMGPATFYVRARPDPRFVARFRERARARLHPRGPFATEMQPLYERRAAEVERAIVCEISRWADVHGGPGYGVSDWQAERNRLRRVWFPRRTPIVVRQLKKRGLY